MILWHCAVDRRTACHTLAHCLHALSPALSPRQSAGCTLRGVLLRAAKEACLTTTVARRLDPKDLGIKHCEVEDLRGGDAALNASILRDVFGGQQGAVADALCLNAGVALAACGQATDAKAGIQLAQVRGCSSACACVLQVACEAAHRAVYNMSRAE